MADTSVSYKCPNCSAPLSFLPGNDKVTCEYCGTEFEVKTIEEMFSRQEERAAQEAEAKEAKWDTEHAGSEFTEDESAYLKTFTCSSCGTELVCDENTIATECCYCGNPTMIPSRFKGMLKPDYVIPFKKTKEEAVEALKKFYEGRKLLPDAFTANNRVEDIQPMYVPFWLFDSEVTASAVFKAENDLVIDTPDAIVTETSVYDVERIGTMKFERIPVDGSEKMDDAYMESIEPFDYSEMVPFTTAYLTGYLADKYDVSAEASVPRADKRVENSAAGVLDETVTGYMRHQMESCAVRKDVGSVKYALVPVWILTTRYNNQPYTFMMNGQTGKFIGSLPWDKGKATKYQALATLIPLPIIYFIAKFLIG